MLSVDFSRNIGEIRRLNGVNLAPRITRGFGSPETGANALFKALNIPIPRFHDAPLDNPGARLD
jgi:hypothetical protein